MGEQETGVGDVDVAVGHPLEYVARFECNVGQAALHRFRAGQVEFRFVHVHAQYVAFVADALRADGVPENELAAIGRQLSDFLEDPRTFHGGPRVVQCWGRAPG